MASRRAKAYSTKAAPQRVDLEIMVCRVLSPHIVSVMTAAESLSTDLPAGLCCWPSGAEALGVDRGMAEADMARGEAGRVMKRDRTICRYSVSRASLRPKVFIATTA